VVIGPVTATGTHPGTVPLGWPQFMEMALAASVPAYAIGGMSAALLPTAQAHGAQGIAGISTFW
jgi:8-oxo-dGTP diphosphatase